MLRASDADRELIAERLRKAALEGRLLAEELEQRLGAALRARTYGELDALVADLPAERAPARRAGSLTYLKVPAIAFGVILLAAALLAVAALIVTGTVLAGGAWLFFGFMLLGCRRRSALYTCGRYRRYGYRLPASRWR